jgi:serine/threonine protein kinase
VVGKSLGPYRILEQLGKGGMGEVWLAEDTRLGRKVAVKVLPEAVAADPDRLSRFEQEARAAAALNHPNIAALHDVGVETVEGADGPTHYMVQEYLKGDTLRDVIARGPLSIAKALPLAVEIGEALRTAHRAGIVHRDLKPENVFVTSDGHAKVLDFGLAKLIDMGLPSGVSASMSPTMTMAGQIMGTAGFMAPEQVQGEEVDERADLFAFGCVLYEMIAGRQAFAGDNVHETLSRILTAQPEPLRDVRQGLPARLQWLVDKLLAKDREQRYQTAGDVVVDLRQIAAEGESGELGAPSSSQIVTRPRRSTGSIVILAAVALLIGVAAGWMLKRFVPPPPQRAVRFDVMLRQDSGFSSTYNRVLAISPTGTHLAFTAEDNLWLHSLDRSRPELVRNATGSRSPAFSPDGTQIAFWAGGQMKRLALDGGVPIVVGPNRERPLGMAWEDDGFIYVGRAGQGIWRFPEAGGNPEQVLAVEAGEFAHGPSLLPGGEWVLYTLGRAVRSWRNATIVAQSLDTGERRVLVERGREARYTRSGHLVYVTDGSLFATPFDARKLAVTGSAIAMEDAVQTSALDETGAAAFDVSMNGTLAFAPPGGWGSREVGLLWMDGEGATEPLPTSPRRFGLLELSPDDRTIATQIDEIEGTHVWIYSVERDGGQRLTTTGRNTNPIWSHDGRYVYFASDRGGDIDIWRRVADLSAPAEIVLELDGAQLPNSVTADGKWIFFSDMVPSNSDIGRVSLDGGAVVERLVESPADEVVGDCSPDGRFVAFQSDETGRWDVHVLEIETGRRWIVTPEQGYDPRWARDGSRILYRTTTSQIKGVMVTMQPDFAVSDPFVAFETDLARHSRMFTTTRDGSRILLGNADVVQETTAETRPRVTVVLNWFDELGSRAPAGP